MTPVLAPPEVRGTRPVALREVQPGQVVERDGDIGVVGAERLLADGESALVERLGVGVAALVCRTARPGC